MDGRSSRWRVIAEHDDAAAVVAALFDLDPDAEYTKTELSEAADVPLKSLYLDGTLDALVDVGLLERHQHDGEETTYAVAADDEAYEAAKAFDAAAPRAESA